MNFFREVIFHDFGVVLRLPFLGWLSRRNASFQSSPHDAPILFCRFVPLLSSVVVFTSRLLGFWRASFSVFRKARQLVIVIHPFPPLKTVFFFSAHSTFFDLTTSFALVLLCNHLSLFLTAKLTPEGRKEKSLPFQLWSTGVRPEAMGIGDYDVVLEYMRQTVAKTKLNLVWETPAQSSAALRSDPFPSYSPLDTHYRFHTQTVFLLFVPRPGCLLFPSSIFVVSPSILKLVPPSSNR